MQISFQDGICQMFYTSKIPHFFIFTQENRVNREIGGREIRKQDTLLSYFEIIVIFFAIIYSNTNLVQVFCENSSLSLAIFTE